MRAWPGKFVIGLTGNIATGKSVVRKMLEHLGAYGIDADALGHRAIAKGAPAYQPVINIFGRYILGPDEQIDRSKLARLVFGDPAALKQLETIVHPFVRQAVDLLIRRSTQKVIVVEAIKLLESPLRQRVDSLWVTFAKPEVQIARLVQKRGMTEELARQRVAMQAPQEDKMAAADIVIFNNGNFEEAWRQAAASWLELFPSEEATSLPAATATRGEMVVERARPRQAAEIAAFIGRVSGGQRNLSGEDIMAAFGEKAYIFLMIDQRPVGLVGWQVENLVARTDDVYLEANLPLANAMKVLLNEVEDASRNLQCEASLLFLPAQFSQHDEAWRSLGYEPRTIQNLGVRAWQEAALETMSRDEVMYFKQLRQDRVLRPV
ncbi:MAG: dephospho-CoA kinase [Chloroflexi bacterium RBG_19FT_COMBO_56_12]|nr:MAG: dephospho-CoA kinase [Chloroflexi bacterium RBG_19FT_COMBO_56_12]